MAKYLYIVGTLAFTVYGQLIAKWQMNRAGQFPIENQERLLFMLKLMANPWIISSVVGAFLAFLCWLGALGNFQLSYVYPFMSLAFVIVLCLSAVVFGETINLPRLIGVALIVLGIIVQSRS